MTQSKYVPLTASIRFASAPALNLLDNVAEEEEALIGKTNLSAWVKPTDVTPKDEDFGNYWDDETKDHQDDMTDNYGMRHPSITER